MSSSHHRAMNNHDASSLNSGIDGYPELLKAIPFPDRGWQNPISGSLILLTRTLGLELSVFSRLERLWELSELELVKLAGSNPSGLRIKGTDLQKTFPLAATLNEFLCRPEPAPVCSLLLGLALEITIRDPASKIPTILLSNIRGFLEPKRSLANLDFNEASTLDDLLAVFDDLDARSERFEHATFSRLWSSELKSLVLRLKIEYQNHRAFVESIKSKWTNGTLENSVVATLSATDDDEPEDFRTDVMPEKKVNQKVDGPRTQLAKARAYTIKRHSNSKFLLTPEMILPVSIAKKLNQDALNAFNQLLPTNDFHQLERIYGLLLAINTGIDDLELTGLTFGKEPTTGLVLDLDRRILIRPECRPPSAFTPDKKSVEWQKTGGNIKFVISKTLVDAGKKLQHQRGVPITGENYLISADSRTGIRPASADLLLTMRSVSAGELAKPSELRERIVATITERLGPEAAQIAFGDSFGITAVGTYYSRYVISEIMSSAWSAVAQIYDEPLNLDILLFDDEYWLGSKVAPCKESLARFHAYFKTKRKRASQLINSEVEESWQILRDNLAIILIRITAHRPTAALRRIYLYDLVPDHMAIVISDKRSDPAHLTRIASLCPRALEVLRDYLDFLIKISRKKSKAAELATNILKSESPLLSAIGTNGEINEVDIALLLSSFPSEISSKKNILRHLINQELQLAGMDFELRHQQMGWMVSGATVLSDCSPYSVLDFASEISPRLDHILETSELCHRTPAPRKWAWNDIYLPPLRSWSDAVIEHGEDHAAANAALKQALFERRRLVLNEIRPNIISSIEAHLPDIEVSTSTSLRLVLRNQNSKIIDVSEQIVERIIESTTPINAEPIHNYVVRAELARLLRVGNSAKITSGFIPSYQRLSTCQNISPFLKGSGLAVRQTLDIRKKVEDESVAWEKIGKGHAESLAFRAVLSVITTTNYRSFEDAERILSGVNKCAISKAKPGVLRIPVNYGQQKQYVVTGVTAQLLLRLKALSSDAPSISKSRFGNLFRKTFPHLIGNQSDPCELVDVLVGTLQVAGRIELAGPERKILMSSVRLATVEIGRSVANDDHWPAITGEMVGKDKAYSEEADLPKQAPAKGETELMKLEPDRSMSMENSVDEDVRNLKVIMREINPKFKGRLSKTNRLVKDGHYSRKTSLIEEMREFCSSMKDRKDSLAMINHYIYHLATVGGSRKSSGLELISIYTMIKIFGKILVKCSDELNLSECDAETIESIYLAVLFHKTGKPRRAILEEIRKFHSYIAKHFGVTDIEWGELYRIAGSHEKDFDPALLREDEVHLVNRQLKIDMSDLNSLATVDPQVLRIRSLSWLAFTFLDASACRPGSIYGLTYGDIYYDDDVIRIRKTGNYGSAKTETSCGYIRLDGDIWSLNKGAVKEWFDSEEKRMGNQFDRNLPIFGGLETPEERVLWETISRRIGNLIRWSTNEKNARNYWLRKRRIAMRHEQIGGVLQCAKARHVYRALSQSGHVDILTPMQSYLSDPVFHSCRSLIRQSTVSAGVAFSLSKLKRVTFNQRLKRHGGSRSVRDIPALERMGVVLTGMGIKPKVKPANIIFFPAPEIEKSKNEISITDISSIVEVIANEQSLHFAAIKSGATLHTAIKVENLLNEFKQRTGLQLGGMKNQLSPPRLTKSVQNLLVKIQTKEFSSTFLLLAGYWINSAARVSLNAGWPVPVDSEKQDVSEFLTRLGCTYTIKPISEVQVITKLSYLDGGGTQSNGIWTAIRWYLLMYWIKQGLYKM